MATKSTTHPLHQNDLARAYVEAICELGSEAVADKLTELAAGHGPETLPETDDLTALASMRDDLFVARGQCFAVLGDRTLCVWWDDEDEDNVGWAWETIVQGADVGTRESGELDTVTELDELLAWVRA